LYRILTNEFYKKQTPAQHTAPENRIVWICVNLLAVWL